MKNRSLIIFITGQIVGLILLLIASLSPMNLLNEYGTNAFAVWSIAAGSSLLSIVFWKKFLQRIEGISKRKKRWLSLSANLPNIIVLSTPLILFLLTLSLAFNHSRDMRNYNEKTTQPEAGLYGENAGR